MKIYARAKKYYRVSANERIQAAFFLCKNCICIRISSVFDDSNIETMHYRMAVQHIGEYNNIMYRILRHNAPLKLANEVKILLDLWRDMGKFSFSDKGWYEIKER